MYENDGVARAIMSAKAMNVKSFLRVWTKFFTIKQVFCASAKAMYKSDQAPRHFTRNACPCQVLFADMCKIILIKEGLGAGLQIYENYGKLQKIKLDTKTPRAAPGNWLALFYE